MKVNDSNIGGLSSAGIGRTQEVDAGGKAKQKGAVAGALSNDNVQLSDLSSALQSLQSDSPERTAHLERLAADVASGRYKPDVREVSKGIVDEALKGARE